jgi:hypothetical protein
MRRSVLTLPRWNMPKCSGAWYSTWVYQFCHYFVQCSKAVEQGARLECIGSTTTWHSILRGNGVMLSKVLNRNASILLFHVPVAPMAT